MLLLLILMANEDYALILKNKKGNREAPRTQRQQPPRRNTQIWILGVLLGVLRASAAAFCTDFLFTLEFKVDEGNPRQSSRFCAV